MFDVSNEVRLPQSILPSSVKELTSNFSTTLLQTDLRQGHMPEERAYAVQLYVVPLPCQPCIEHTGQALRAELQELPSGVFVLSMHECMTWQIWPDSLPPVPVAEPPRIPFTVASHVCAVAGNYVSSYHP